MAPHRVRHACSDRARSFADLPAFAGAILILMLIGLLASYLPARRGSRTDPIGALRQL